MLGGKKTIGGVALLLLGIGGWFWWQARPPKALFVTETVSRGDVLETVSVVGKLQPKAYADLSFPLIGTLKKIFVVEKEMVRQGDVLMVLDTAVLESEQKKALMALAIAEENEKLAHRTWDDLKPEERAVKKLATKQARENVRTVAAQIEESRLVAPIDGTLSKLDARVGETVLGGKVIGRVSGGGDFLLEAEVPEADIARLAIGQKATVAFDAFSSQEILEAVVTSIDSSANVIQDVIYYTVTFQLTEPDVRLKEGMSADIDITISERQNVLTVPYRAIERNGAQVFVEIAKSPTESERRLIQIGIEGDDGTMEVIAGLEEGEMVIVSRQK